MEVDRVRRASWCLLLGLAAVQVSDARAALGGDAASITADALGASVEITDRTGYVVHAFSSATGVRIREYLGADGTVFAVSWSGPVPADLSALLGRHFTDYTTALATLPHSGLQRSVHLVLPGAIVDSGGHLRAYAGRAWLPQLTPAGVVPGDIP